MGKSKDNESRVADGKSTFTTSSLRAQMVRRRTCTSFSLTTPGYKRHSSKISARTDNLRQNPSTQWIESLLQLVPLRVLHEWSRVGPGSLPFQGTSKSTLNGDVRCQQPTLPAKYSPPTTRPFALWNRTCFIERLDRNLLT
jgi:hypothetical protein